MKISVIGTGAVGGFYGCLLVASGNEVHFLLRSDYDHVKKHGLKLTSPMGEIHVFPHEYEGEDAKYRAYFYKNPDELPVDSDFIIVSIKATENDKLPDLLQSFKNKNASIILLQNGLGQENHVHVQLPRAHRVFGGLAFLCSVKEGPGLIHHIDYGDLTLAESIPGGSPAEIDLEIEKIGKTFRNARISVTIESDLLLARWQKLVWNIPFNGLSVILNASTEELITHPNSLNLVREIMKEVQKVAQGEGKSITDAFLEERIQRTFRMKPYTPSMKLDYDNKRPMELEAIYMDPLLRAEILGIKIPRIQTLYQELSFLEHKNLANLEKINHL